MPSVKQTNFQTVTCVLKVCELAKESSCVGTYSQGGIPFSFVAYLSMPLAPEEENWLNLSNTSMIDDDHTNIIIRVTALSLKREDSSSNPCRFVCVVADSSDSLCIPSITDTQLQQTMAEAISVAHFGELVRVKANDQSILDL